MKRGEVDLFEKNYAQMEALYAEISALSKKKPTDAVNKFKLKFINKVLEEAKAILKENYSPFADFESFDEDELPMNSDVAMILAQYISCMEKLHSDNTGIKDYEWCWYIDGKLSKIITYAPKKKKG